MVKTLAETIHDLLHGVEGERIRFDPNRRVFKNPLKLPPLGRTSAEVTKRIQCVEASMAAYPEIYTEELRVNMALLEYVGRDRNILDWGKFIRELNAVQGNTDEKIDLAFRFVSEGDDEQRMFKGILCGLYEGSTRLMKVQRWVYFDRLRKILGEENNPVFEEKVLDHPVMCMREIPQNKFQEFLKQFGDYKNTPWEDFKY